MFSYFKKIVGNYKIYLGFIVSFFFLYLTIKQSHFSYKNLNFTDHQFRLFGLSVLVFLFTIIIQALRSKFIWINSLKDFLKIKMYGSIIIGNFYNCILPSNLGEGMRAWHFHRKNKVSLSNSISAIVIEKIVDAQLFVPLIIILNIIHTPKGSDYIMLLLNFILILILITDIFLMALLLSKRLKKYLFFFVPTRGLKKKLYKIFLFSRYHVYALFQNKWIWIYAPLGYVMFALNMLQYGLLLKAINVGVPIMSIYSLLLISCSMIIFSFLPSAPSSIGVVHYGIFYALCYSASVFGVKLEIPLLQKFAMMGILLHASYFLPETILGVFFLFRERKWLV